MQFLNSLKTQMKFHNLPFNHWELDKPLNEGALQEICNAEIVDLNKIMDVEPIKPTMDELLDKISNVGLDKLSKIEKQYLKEYSKKQ